MSHPVPRLAIPGNQRRAALHALQMVGMKPRIGEPQPPARDANKCRARQRRAQQHPLLSPALEGNFHAAVICYGRRLLRKRKINPESSSQLTKWFSSGHGRSRPRCSQRIAGFQRLCSGHLQVGRWSVSVAQTILAVRLRASLAATTTTKYRSAAEQAAPRANFSTRRRRTNPRVATLRQGLFLWLFLFSPVVNDSDGQPVVRLQWVSCQEQQIAEVCFLVIEFKHAGRPMLRKPVFNAESSRVCVRSAGPGGRSEAAVQRKVHNLVAGPDKKLAG